MKLITQFSIALLFLLVSNQVFSQEEVVLQTERDTTQINDSDEVFVFVTDGPSFIGGDEARLNYFINNIHYPKQAKEKHMQGTVYVTFIVEKDGSVSNVKVLRGVCPSIDQESIRVVKNMPKWKPGLVKEKPVRVQFNLPIRFFLTDGSDVEPMSKAEWKAYKKKQKAEEKAKKKTAKAAQKK